MDTSAFQNRVVPIQHEARCHAVVFVQIIFVVSPDNKPLIGSAFGLLHDMGSDARAIHHDAVSCFFGTQLLTLTPIQEACRLGIQLHIHAYQFVSFQKKIVFKGKWFKSCFEFLLVCQRKVQSEIKRTVSAMYFFKKRNAF